MAPSRDALLTLIALVALMEVVTCRPHMKPPHVIRNKRSYNYPYYEELMKQVNTNQHKRYGVQKHSIKRRDESISQPRPPNHQMALRSPATFPDNLASEVEIPSFQQYKFNDMEIAMAQTLYAAVRSQLRKSMDKRLNDLVHQYMWRADQYFQQKQRQLSAQFHKTPGG